MDKTTGLHIDDGTMQKLLTLPMFDGQDFLMPNEVIMLLLSMKAQTLLDVLELTFIVYAEEGKMEAAFLLELLTIFHYQDKGTILTDDAFGQLRESLGKVPVVTMDDLVKHPVVQASVAGVQG